jgi:protein SCO1/2
MNPVRLAAALLLAGAVACLAAASQAHTAADATMPEVGVDERLGGRVPLDLPFVDADGKPVRLSAAFEGGTPVLLTLNYFSCQTLCPLTFRKLTGTIGAMGGLSLARDYRVLTVSIDPEEVPGLAKAKSRESWAMLPGVAGLPARWPFLTGDNASISALARAVGMRYTRIGKNDFAHPTLAVVLTPEGRISRYFYELDIRPQDLRLALIEAGGGRIGNPVLNRVLLYCYHYDPAGRRYSLIAMNVMKLGGGAVLLLLGILLLFLWRRERGKGGSA